jgi:hypothetical protein
LVLDNTSDDSDPKLCLVTGKKVDQSLSRFFQASVRYWTLALDDSSFSADRLSTDDISIRKSACQLLFGVIGEKLTEGIDSWCQLVLERSEPS